MDLIYGPVSSWRLGRSLGVDLICREGEKVCPFDCIYCSLGRTTEKTIDRQVFVDTQVIDKEFQEIPDDIEADVLTISGTGEPTLASNMGDVLDLAREIFSLPIAILTNSALMSRNDVREELSKADIVVGSLDAPNPALFKKLNEPYPSLDFEEIIQGMKDFAREFDGIFSLEAMFVPQTRDFAQEIAEIARSIGPDEVQINTPLRKSPAEPLTPEELEKVRKSFSGLKTRSVFESEKPKISKIIGREKLDLLKRPDEE